MSILTRTDHTAKINNLTRWLTYPDLDDLHALNDHDSEQRKVIEQQAQRIQELEAALGRQQIDIRKFEQAPCYLCGYNGENYYQPSTHPCAARYHAARQKEES